VDERDDDNPEPRPAVVTRGHPVAGEVIPASRLFGAVGLAGVVHLLCAWGLLRLIAAPPSAGRGLGQHAALIGVVVLTCAVALWTTARARRAGIDGITRTAPAVFGLLPPIASVAISLGRWVLESIGVEQALLDTVALLAATTAPGIAIALVLEYSLWTVGARAGEVAPRSAQRGAPPSLAGRLARLVAGLGVATALLVLTEGLTTGLVDGLAPARTWAALAGCSATMILAVLAAASAGLSPGRDVSALARRLDAIGMDASGDALRALAGPVRVTSFDAVGELFRNLERLRARLAEEVASYQSALDRTHAADAAKREFLAAVSHELRTPLDSILDYAERLLADELSEAQAEDVRLIIAGGRQLRELIDDILDLSVMESSELELRFASCDLAELVDEIVDIHRAQVRGPEVELLAERRGEIPPVVCDRRRIGQVLANLLSNALKFTERGRVHVRVHHDPRRARVYVAVADTGVGIASDELSAIFEEYRQVGARKRRQRGTGLGLAIARRIAEAHGGSLEAQSKLGVGSTFSLQLPLDGEAANPKPGSGGER
jgi:signal transduction histidine kinase